MTNPEVESLYPQLNEVALRQDIYQLGALNGLSGFEVAITPGAGTSCAVTQGERLLITVDPIQIVVGDEHKTPLEQQAPPEVTGLFMIGHEFGHARDYMDPQFRVPNKRTAASDFFDCLIDDTVIDTRNRRVPLFDAHADNIYSHQMPRDMTGNPKHTQLMFGIRLSTVMKEPDFAVDPKVAELLASLKQYEKDGKLIDIPFAMTDPRVSLHERRRIAELYIKPHYDALLKADEQERADRGDSQPGDFSDAYEEYEEAVHHHAQQGDSQENNTEAKEAGNGAPKDQGRPSAGLPQDLAEQIAQAMQQIANAKQSQKDKAAQDAQTQANKESEAANEQKQSRSSELAGSLAKEMQLSQGNAQRYVNSLERWSNTISQVADVLMQLAAPANVIMSPRYKPTAHTEGVRLHPRTMAAVALQLATDQEQAIWQPVARQAHRQDVTFGGLDIHLLVDVSNSMAGQNAQCAADTSLCLIEGLQLARYKVSRKNGQYHQPDVRTQVIAFGSGTEVLSPLAHEPTPQAKGSTYTNVLAAPSANTLVSGALGHVQRAAAARPKRDVITLIISDGIFGDAAQAKEIVNSLPASAHVTQLVIGDEERRDLYITKNHELVSDPTVLPEKLYGVLADYIRRSA